MIRQVISGGQTGADRGGLDAAIELGVEHGGWCTFKRRAEDGRIPDCYELEELPLFGYSHRTYRNVVESDATLVFLFGSEPSGGSGSKVTQTLAKRHLKPLCVVDLSRLGVDGAVDLVTGWIEDCEDLGREIEVLNVAGSRESKAPGMQAAVKRVMLEVLGRCSTSDRTK